MSSPTLAYLLWVALLAALLFWPVSRMVWVLSVRRLERRTGKTLSEAERLGQRRRARFIAGIVSLAFSALYNLHMFAEIGVG